MSEYLHEGPTFFWWECPIEDCAERSGAFPSAAACARGFKGHVAADHPEYVGILPSALEAVS